MKVNILTVDGETIDSGVAIEKYYAGDIILARKGKRRFEFQSGYEKGHFMRGYIKSVAGYLKGQGEYITVILQICTDSTESTQSAKEV